MPDRICVDASLAVAWIVPDIVADKAEALRREWSESAPHLIAPPIFPAEVTSIVRERLYREELTSAEASQALEHSFAWPITIWQGDDDILQRSALALATRFNHPKAYDAQYLAVASLLSCDLWTADEKLVRSVRGELPWLRWIGDYRP